jgi:hypothetical protein
MSLLEGRCRGHFMQVFARAPLVNDALYVGTDVKGPLKALAMTERYMQR